MADPSEKSQRVPEESMIICDLCGKAKDCLQKEMDGKEYDICAECWDSIAQKLKGKGRTKIRETVFLPPPRVPTESEPEQTQPLPGEPPKIWGAVARPESPEAGSPTS
jgi:hypothetical protein